MTLEEQIEKLLEEKCSGMCLDNEEERKAVASTIANYMQEASDDRSSQGDDGQEDQVLGRR